MTRRMRDTESAFTLNFYVQCGFILVSTTMGLVVGDGHLSGSTDASLAFLLRPWVWPPTHDWPAFLATGLAVGIGGLMMSQAYRRGGTDRPVRICRHAHGHFLGRGVFRHLAGFDWLGRHCADLWCRALYPVAGNGPAEGGAWRRLRR